MNLRNYKHGLSGTAIYYCWQHLKRSPGGVCLSWRNITSFVEDVGLPPSSEYWLFRAQPYQRSHRGNVEWHKYAKQLQPVWQYLTPGEITNCEKHIAFVCKRGGYDYDAGINELYSYNLKGIEKPVHRIHSWIKRYLPKILAVLKKQRGETIYNDKIDYSE